MTTRTVPMERFSLTGRPQPFDLIGSVITIRVLDQGFDLRLRIRL